MTDIPTPPPAETIEQRGQRAAAALRQPGALLARAMMYLDDADGILTEAEALDDAYGIDHVDRSTLRIELANAITRVVQAAYPVPEFEVAAPTDFGAMMEQAREIQFTPQPVTGTRFVADLSGQHVGMVGGRDWLHIPGHGFIDISHFEESLHLDGDVSYKLAGRVVSGTPDHVLLVDDGGNGCTLPRGIDGYTEHPDDDR